MPLPYVDVVPCDPNASADALALMQLLNNQVPYQTFLTGAENGTLAFNVVGGVNVPVVDENYWNLVSPKWTPTGPPGPGFSGYTFSGWEGCYPAFYCILDDFLTDTVYGGDSPQLITFDWEPVYTQVATMCSMGALASTLIQPLRRGYFGGNWPICGVANPTLPTNTDHATALSGWCATSSSVVISAANGFTTSSGFIPATTEVTFTGTGVRTIPFLNGSASHPRTIAVQCAAAPTLSPLNSIPGQTSWNYLLITYETVDATGFHNCNVVSAPSGGWTVASGANILDFNLFVPGTYENTGFCNWAETLATRLRFLDERGIGCVVRMMAEPNEIYSAAIGYQIIGDPHAPYVAAGMYSFVWEYFIDYIIGTSRTTPVISTATGYQYVTRPTTSSPVHNALWNYSWALVNPTGSFHAFYDPLGGDRRLLVNPNYVDILTIDHNIMPTTNWATYGATAWADAYQYYGNKIMGFSEMAMSECAGNATPTGSLVAFMSQFIPAEIMASGECLDTYVSESPTTLGAAIAQSTTDAYSSGGGEGYNSLCNQINLETVWSNPRARMWTPGLRGMSMFI